MSKLYDLLNSMITVINGKTSKSDLDSFKAEMQAELNKKADSSTVDAMNLTIDSMQTDVDDLNGEVQTLKNSVELNSSEIDELQAKLGVGSGHTVTLIDEGTNVLQYSVNGGAPVDLESPGTKVLTGVKTIKFIQKNADGTDFKITSGYGTIDYVDGWWEDHLDGTTDEETDTVYITEDTTIRIKNTWSEWDTSGDE